MTARIPDEVIEAAADEVAWCFGPDDTPQDAARAAAPIIAAWARKQVLAEAVAECRRLGCVGERSMRILDNMLDDEDGGDDR